MKRGRETRRLGAPAHFSALLWQLISPFSFLLVFSRAHFLLFSFFPGSFHSIRLASLTHKSARVCTLPVCRIGTRLTRNSSLNHLCNLSAPLSHSSLQSYAYIVCPTSFYFSLAAALSFFFIHNQFPHFLRLFLFDFLFDKSLVAYRDDVVAIEVSFKRIAPFLKAVLL